ncbi:hypothetical protein GCM10025778_05340 [Paeniglutamicibacter antarcticus]|uniref:Uncharacterized protein n=1 Tax=Paeniglutamicibacter antarcticus TaxID=494023 RepID=A0ABP9TGB4_9MICC
MGVITAPANSVAVMTQEASEAVVFSSVGNCAISGTTSVCIRETTMPTNARIVTAALGEGFLFVGNAGLDVMGLANWRRGDAPNDAYAPYIRSA